MTDTKYSIGDPVWSKMKGYCAWPSRIAAPSESALRNTAADKLKTPKVHYLVYFFGSNNFAWMPEDTIKPYEEFKEKNKNGSKNAQFKQGLKQIEEYIASGGKATLADTTTGSAIKNVSNNDDATSPSAGGDSLSNDASNIDGDLPSIDEEIAAIHNRKPALSSASSKKLKNSHDSHHDSSSLTSPAPSSVQKDYSRTPFKSRKTKSSEESATETNATKRVKVLTSDDDSFRSSSPLSPHTSTAITTSKPPTSKSGARNVLLRASQYTDMPIFETPQVNMSFVSAKSRTIRASTLKFGFIGLGFMGQRILKNLLNSGHQVTIWNRTPSKCKEFLDVGAAPAKTPADVVTAADIIFSCLSDPMALKEIVFGSFGVLVEMDSSKGFVDMTSIDPETSNDISEAIMSRGGRYLEAPMVSNGKKAAEDGELIIIAAGDKRLYEDCSSCFQAMAKQTFFMSGRVGMAHKMNLTLSMLYGSIVGAVAETCALAVRADLTVTQVREILKISTMMCPLMEPMLEKIISRDTSVNMSLSHLQKDLRLSLNLSEDFEQPIPITAAVNEVFKGAKRGGYGEHDVSSVYLRSRF